MTKQISKQQLFSIFSEEMNQFEQLVKIWNAIKLAKRRAIQDNLTTKEQSWRNKFRLEEIKEEYLQAVIMEKTCNELASLCSLLYVESIHEEETELWQQLKKKLSAEEIERLRFLTEYQKEKHS